MQAYQLKWFKGQDILNVDSYKVARIKEDDQLEQNKLNYMEHVIGTTAGDVYSFEDATPYDDRTAYHYLVIGLSGTKVVIISEWTRVWRRHNWGIGGNTIIKGDEVFGYMGDLEGVDNFVDENINTSTFNYKRDIVAKYVINGNIVYVPYVGFVGSNSFTNPNGMNPVINAGKTYIEGAGLSEITLGGINLKHDMALPDNVINTLVPVIVSDSKLFVVNKPFGYDEYGKNFATNVIYANAGNGGLYNRFDFGSGRPSSLLTTAGTSSSNSNAVYGFRTLGAWIETVPEEVVEP